MDSGISRKFRLAAIVAMAGLIVAVIAFLRESPRSGEGSDTPAVPVASQPAQSPEQSASAPLGAVQAPTPKPGLFSTPAVPPAATPVPAERPAGIAQRSPVAAPAADPPSPRARTSPGDPIASDEERRNAAIALDKVALMVRDYRTRMGENPVGTNSEIMKALMGANPKGARFGPPVDQRLNADGELIDQWGTPIFFHQLSRTDMEVRSAGLDRALYTEDDVVTH